MIKELKKIVAVYIRCSRDEAKKEGYSPEIQEERLKEFVKINGWQLDEKHVYNKDIGHSGSTDKRPDLQRLLKDARNKEFDMVLVLRQDRFFRNLRLLLNTVGELRELGIEFKSITEGFDTSTPSGRAMFNNAGVFSEWQREVNLESRNDGMIKAMQAGKWLGGTPPYGYRFNRKTQKLKIDKQEAKIVRMMFDWLVSEKLSKYKIQERLNERKVPTKWLRLKRRPPVNLSGWWNARTVERILKNEIYAGEFYYRKYRYLKDDKTELKPETESKPRIKLRPREEWIKIKVPAIISSELFNKAQEQWKKNQQLSPRRTENVYVFQHKLSCGIDGFPYHSMFRVPAKPQWKGTKVYFCGGKIRHSHSKLCSSPYITESRLLPTVWENLKTLLTEPETAMENIQEYRDRDSKRKSVEQELERVNKALMSDRKEKKKILKLYREDYIDEPDYKETFDEIVKGELTHQKEMERLSQLLLTEKEKENRAFSISKLYERIKDSFESPTYEFQHQVIQKLVEGIKVIGGLLEIEYRLPYKEALERISTEAPAEKFCDYIPRMD